MSLLSSPARSRALAAALCLLTAAVAARAEEAGPALRLLAPAPGAVLRADAPCEILWSVRGVTGARTSRVEFSDDGGATWTEVAPEVALATSLLWHTPTRTRTGYALRVTLRGIAADAPIAIATSEFAVDGLYPYACIVDVRGTPARPELAYEAVDRGPAGVAALTVWYRRPGEATWKAAPESHGTPERLDFSAPDGTYEVCLTARDAAGNAAPPPGRGDAPQAVVRVTQGAPDLSVLTPDEGAVLRGGTVVPLRWVVRRADLIPDSVRCEFSRDGGRTWDLLARGLALEGELAWPVPALDLPRGLLRLSVLDTAGASHAASVPSSCGIDVSPPRVTLEAPRTSRAHSVAVQVRATDVGPAGVADYDLYLTQDFGSTWRLLRRAVATETVAECTLEDGTWGFAAAAQDRVGNRTRPPQPGDAPQAVVVVDTVAPELALDGLHDGQVLKGGASIALSWRAQDAHLPSRPVNFRLSSDGGRTWSALRRPDPPSGSGRLEAPVAAGDYRLRVTAADTAGNSTEIERAFTVDMQAPRITLAPFHPWGQLAGGTEAEIQWEAADDHVLAPRPVELLFSPDRGATWTPIAADLPGSGRFAWTIPTLSAPECLLRARALDAAGNRSEATLAVPFAIRASAPAPRRVRTTPVSPVPHVEVEVRFDAADLAFLRELELWATEDGGAHWRQTGRFDPRALPFVPLELAAGEHGLRAVVVDVAGNRSPTPAAGTTPTCSVQVLARPPWEPVPIRTLALELPGAGPFHMGQSVEVRWRLSGDFPAGSALRIELAVVEGAWRPLAEARPEAGVAHVKLPMTEAPACRLRLVVEDAGGGRSETESAAFAIEGRE